MVSSSRTTAGANVFFHVSALREDDDVAKDAAVSFEIPMRNQVKSEAISIDCRRVPIQMNGQDQKPPSKAEIEARKFFRQLDVKLPLSERDAEDKAFHENRERLKAERLAREAGSQRTISK